MTFINKMDRDTKEPMDVLDEIESISTEALQKRILLWDAIEEILDRKNNS